MKTKSLAKKYKHFTPEELFRLIMSASGRNDESELRRLAKASRLVNLTFQDYWPYVQAFNDLSDMTFIELLAEAADYFEYIDYLQMNDDSDNYFDMAMAFGYSLKTKMAGWELFCKNLNVPPFLLWQDYPGFTRLQRAVAQTEKTAFVAEGFLRWLNSIRPKGQAALTTVPLTVQTVAQVNEKVFRNRVTRWGA